MSLLGKIGGILGGAAKGAASAIGGGKGGMLGGAISGAIGSLGGSKGGGVTSGRGPVSMPPSRPMDEDPGMSQKPLSRTAEFVKSVRSKNSSGRSLSSRS